ncbi:MBL fold metallo-hydrolase, partial [Streptomyces sp. alain-838]
MDVIELLPRLHLLRFPVGQAYLWRDGDDLTLVDAGPAGAGAR